MSLADVPLLDLWDRQPHVIAATSDDPDQPKAFGDTYWPDELAVVAPDCQYLVAELDGRPIGAMQIIDPHTEGTHYWGEIEPNLRAIDIWIGAAEDLGKGYGETMMRRAFQICFAEPAVTAIVIDPLASNTRPHKFYRRLGFVPEDRRMFGDDDCLVSQIDPFSVAPAFSQWLSAHSRKLEQTAAAEPPSLDALRRSTPTPRSCRRRPPRPAAPPFQ